MTRGPVRSGLPYLSFLLDTTRDENNNTTLKEVRRERERERERGKKKHQEDRKSVRVEDELFIENVFYIHPLTWLEVPDHTVGLLAVRDEGAITTLTNPGP
jgi:hypothetical protein